MPDGTPEAIQILEGLFELVELIDWIWLLAAVPVGIVFLYFGYRFFEILKFLAGFVVGGLFFGGLVLVATSDVAAGLLALIVGGAVSGYVFRWLINLVPVIIGAMALAAPCYIYLQAGTDIQEQNLILILTGVAAGIGGGIGHWVRVIATVVVTSFMGAAMLVQAAASAHIALGDVEIRAMADPSYLGSFAAIYGVVFVGLLVSGVWVQFRHMARSNRDDVEEPEPAVEHARAASPAVAVQEPARLDAGPPPRPPGPVETGLAQEDGRGMERDAAAPARPRRQAADQGEPVRQHDLAYMYLTARGVERDAAEAVGWFRRAAEQGHGDAQSDVGVLYAAGLGVAPNDAEAVGWFRRAVESGHAAGQANLGVMYEHGRGVGRDEAEAVRLYRLSAEQGHASGQYNLGVLYEHGRGVGRDEAEAVRWYRRAAEQGHPRGQNNLGVMYEEGRGVRPDAAEAVRWYGAAAAQGHELARRNLDRLR